MRWVWALTDVAGEHYLTPDRFFLPVCEQPCRRDDIHGFRTKEAAKRVRRREFANIGATVEGRMTKMTQDLQTAASCSSCRRG